MCEPLPWIIRALGGQLVKRRRQGDLLFYNFTVDDPDVSMEPWTSIMYVRRLNPNPVRQDEAPICDERDIDLLADPYNRG